MWYLCDEAVEQFTDFFDPFGILNQSEMIVSEVLNQAITNQPVEMIGREEFFYEGEGWFVQFFSAFVLLFVLHWSNAFAVPEFMDIPGNDDEIFIDFIDDVIFFFLFLVLDEVFAEEGLLEVEVKNFF